MRGVRSLTVTGVAVVMAMSFSAFAEVQLFVSPTGNDAWSGRQRNAADDHSDGPLATIKGARDAIRKLKVTGGLPEGGVTVTIRGGVYELEQPLEFVADDAGTDAAPVTYAAHQGEVPRVIGGRVVDRFVPVTDRDVLDRLDAPARGRVLQADLAAMGITDYGTLASNGVEIYFKGKPMTLARWPNEGFVEIADVSGEDEVKHHGIPGDRVGKWFYEGDRPRRWHDEDDIWVDGYWFWDWAAERQRIKSIDAEKRMIEVERPYHGYGYRKGQRYYFYNVLGELDTPGEWHVDRPRGRVYFWPPEPITTGSVVVSVLPQLITLAEVSHVNLHGICVEAVRNTAIAISGGTHNCIRGCTIRNVGGNAITVKGGKEHRVDGCSVYYLGGGGIVLSGGDRRTLTPANHSVTNNHIHHFSRTKRTYTPAVWASGVGLRIANNCIHDAPHSAVIIGGNDHVIEYNDIYRVCMETSDAGAFYMGRDWSARGNIVQFNFFHELGHGDVQAVYLDDWASGTLVYGNVCHGARRGVLIGGGRDNIIENNVFVDCTNGVHIDQRGLGWAKGYFDGTTNTLFDRLRAVNATQPPYTQRYSGLVTLLDDEPVLAKGNKVIRNVSYGGQWLELQNNLSESTPYLTIEDNFTEGDPGFVDAQKMDFRLQEDSPVFDTGFKPIPMEKIGRQRGAAGRAIEL